MKKIMALLITLTTVLVVGGCSQIQDAIKTNASSANSLATLSYVSSSFLDSETKQDPVGANFGYMTSHDTTALDSELDDVNKYVDKLKVFIENGTDSLGSIEVEASDHELYNNMIVFTVDATEYILYYNVDQTDGTIVGEFIIGEVTYEIEGYTNFDDVDEIDTFDDDDDEDEEDEEDQVNPEDIEDEEDEEDQVNPEDNEDEDINNEDDDDESEDEDENEEKMILIAKNGDDIIQITYKIETEENEYESKFELEQTINGVYKEITLKIEQEEDEYKVEIEDGNNSYTFKRELEDDNEIEYKLEYDVDGVQGEVKVTETINETGETIYIYEIEENGETHRRDSDDDDDDDDDDIEDDDEEESNL